MGFLFFALRPPLRAAAAASASAASAASHLTPLILHHLPYTTYLTPPILHHHYHTTHLTPPSYTLILHHLSYTTILHHPSYTTHLHHPSHTTSLTTPISHHLSDTTHLRPPSYTTYLEPPILQSLLEQPRRAWSPLGRGCRLCGRRSSQCTWSVDFVAGTVHAASRNSCGARGRRWAAAVVCVAGTALCATGV